MRCAERIRPFAAAALALSAAALLAPAAAARARPGPEGGLQPVERQRHAMGTMFSVIAYHDAPADAARAVDAALAEIVRLDAVLSHYKPSSDLSRLNRDGARGFVAVDPSLYEVVERSLAFSRASDGRFDVTVAPLLRVWKEAFAAGRQPAAAEIAAARRCVGHQLVETSPPNRIRLRSDCAALDLGGIGKGYAVDRALAVLEAAGVRHAIVNGGGSTMAAIGAPPGFDGWPVELGAAVAGRRTLLLRDEAISTSQQHLRHLPFAPGAFGEIIDPRREAPLEAQTIVSVVTDDATRADALSTTLLLMPVAEGERLLERFAPASALWISPAGALQHAFRTSQLTLAHLP
jgi:thiamine biosynthesis lipoprotein